MNTHKEAEIAAKKADAIVEATSDAPVHSFDPYATPEQKAAAAAGKGMPENLIGFKDKGAVTTELGTANAGQVKDAIASASAKPVVPIGTSSKADVPIAKKSVEQLPSKVGWRDVGGLGTRDPSKLPPDVPPPRDVVAEFLNEAYFGQWWHNAAVILFAVTGTWLVTKIGGGLAHCLIIGVFLATYYQTSIRRVRRNARDDITRELSKSRLESEDESAEWLNNFLARFWLIYEPVLSATIVQIADQVLVDNTPAFLDSIRLSTFTLGTKAPRIGSVKTYPRAEPNEVVMDWRVNFTPTDTSDLTKRELLNKVNPKIILAIRVGKGIVSADIPVLLEDMNFQGYLRIKLRLMANFPHIKSVDISFLEPPLFDYVLKPIGGDKLGFDINNIPGLAPFIRDQVHATLGPMMYAPNVFTLDLEAIMAGGAAIESAIGVLAVTVYSGKGLKNTELIGTADPYVKFHINNRPELARTSTKLETTVPRWNETYFLLINNLNEVLSLEVMDYNANTKDKSMGVGLFDLKKLESQLEHEDCAIDVTRNGKNYGSLKCDFVYYPVSKERKLVDGTIEPALESNTGILHITIHQAQNLDPSKSMVGQYNPYAVLKINGVQKFQSKKLKRTNNPTWEQSYESLIIDKSNVMLDIQILDNRDILDDPVVASWAMSLTDLLAANGSSQRLDWFPFKGVDGKIRVSAQWKPVLMAGAEHALHGIYVPPIGVIRLNVVKARDLRNVELMTGGKSDPYLQVLSVSQVRARTSIIEGELNPVWNEIFYIPIHSIKEDLLLEVMDWQSVTNDRSLGVAELVVKNLMKETVLDGAKIHSPGKPFAGWTQLHSKNRKDAKGEVYFEASFFPTLKLAKEAKEEAKREVEEETQVDGQPTNTKPNVDTATVVSSAPFKVDSKVDVHGQQIEVTPEGQVDLLKYRAGVLGVTFLEATFPQSIEGLAELYVDSHEPLFKSIRTSGQILQFQETGDAFVKELDFSRVTIKITQNVKINKGNAVVGSWTSDVLTIVKSLAALKDGDDGSIKVKLNENGGELKVAFKYTPVINFTLDPSESFENQGILSVSLIKGNNLYAADKGGTSDPYVTFMLNGEKVYKSEPVKKSLNPVFQNEQFKLQIASRTAANFGIEVFDWNQFSEKFSLGTAQIPLGGDNISCFQAVEKSYPLTGPHGQGSVTLNLLFQPELLQRKRTTTAIESVAKKVAGVPLGVVGGGAKVLEAGVGGGVKALEMGVGGLGSGFKATGSLLGFGSNKNSEKSTLLPPPASSKPPADGVQLHGELKVTLFEAKGLRAVDRGGTSDPYVKVRQGKNEVYKTSTIKKNLNPQWNESFNLNVTETSAPLSLTVMDHNTVGSDEKIGFYELAFWDHLAGQSVIEKWIELPGGDGQLRLKLEFTAK